MTEEQSELSQPVESFKISSEDQLKKSQNSEDLSESCKKVSFLLTMMAVFQIVTLITLVVGVSSFWFQNSEMVTWCILAAFGVMLAVIHWTSVPLADSLGDIFHRIEQKIPAAASRAVRCNRMISRVKSSVAFFKGAEIVCLCTFPISFPGIGIFAAFLFFSVFAIDGKTGEPWGVPGLVEGISGVFTLISFFVLLAAVVIAVLHFQCFFSLFVVSSELNNLCDLPAIKQTRISKQEKR